MPTGVYKRTEQNRRNMSKVLKGKAKSELHKQNISESKKGNKNPMYGKTHPEEIRTKISKTELGHIGYMLGKKHSYEAKLKMSESHKGEKNINFGKKMSESQKKKLRDAHKGKILLDSTRKKMSESRKLEKHPNWQGGITNISASIRNNPKMKEWKNKVFERDNFVDWFSGCKGNLEAHHIIPFSKLMKDHNIHTLEDALMCNALWDTNNGITLLKSNHKSYHTLWG